MAYDISPSSEEWRSIMEIKSDHNRMLAINRYVGQLELENNHLQSMRDELKDKVETLLKEQKKVFKAIKKTTWFSENIIAEPIDGWRGDDEGGFE